MGVENKLPRGPDTPSWAAKKEIPLVRFRHGFASGELKVDTVVYENNLNVGSFKRCVLNKVNEAPGQYGHGGRAAVFVNFDVNSDNNQELPDARLIDHAEI